MKNSLAIPLALMSILFFLAISSLSANPVTDDFSLGTVGLPPGNTGSNWSNAAGTPTLWTNFSSNSAATVQNTNPLESGGGNYLSQNANSGTSSLYRQWNSVLTNGGVDTTLPYTVSFSLRVDTFQATNGTLRIYDQTAGGSTTANIGFQLRLLCTNGVGNWNAFNFPGNGTSSGSYDTGVNGSVGSALDFTITCNTNNYQLQIGQNNNSTILYDSSTNYPGGLGYRTATPSTPRNFLNFGGAGLSSTDTLIYSIDNIAISNVPEPSTFALFGISVLALMIAVRRKKA